MVFYVPLVGGGSGGEVSSFSSLLTSLAGFVVVYPSVKWHTTVLRLIQYHINEFPREVPLDHSPNVNW